MLEVCVDSWESAVNAIKGGADELELCSSLSDGGLTPSPGLVKQVLQMVRTQPSNKRTKVNVMLRCRGGDDFVYSRQEMETMMCDLEIYKQMGVDRFVFGALTSYRQIDLENCLKLISFAKPLPVTFHRAFDLVENPVPAIESIINLGCTRLLTSGRCPSAAEAIPLLHYLNETYGNYIEIMPGAGVNESNVREFIDMGCKIVHSSCKKVVYLPKFDSRLTLGLCDNKVFITDEKIVRNMKDIIKAWESDVSGINVKAKEKL